MDILPPSLSVSQALLFLGNVSKSTFYASIRNDTFPSRVLRINNRIVIPTMPLLEAVGMPADKALEMLNQAVTNTEKEVA
ncbi:DNA-binding protein [Corynebacterium tuberculostearicum]|nr:DNA-binding protein [Corynebacterium tuberculostearicum]